MMAVSQCRTFTPCKRNRFDANLELIEPKRIKAVMISPRQRAQKTYKILLNDYELEKSPNVKVRTTNDLSEWDYGA